VNRPAQIPEVALELAEDGRNRERGERGPPAGVEAVYCLDQTQARDLQKIIERLVRAAVAPRQLACERQKALNQLLTSAGIALLLPPDEQLVGVNSVRHDH